MVFDWDLNLGPSTPYQAKYSLKILPITISINFYNQINANTHDYATPQFLKWLQIKKNKYGKNRTWLFYQMKKLLN